MALENFTNCNLSIAAGHQSTMHEANANSATATTSPASATVSGSRSRPPDAKPTNYKSACAPLATVGGSLSDATASSVPANAVFPRHEPRDERNVAAGRRYSRDEWQKSHERSNQAQRGSDDERRRDEHEAAGATASANVDGQCEQLAEALCNAPAKRGRCSQFTRNFEQNVWTASGRLSDAKLRVGEIFRNGQQVVRRSSSSPVAVRG